MTSTETRTTDDGLADMLESLSKVLNDKILVGASRRGPKHPAPEVLAHAAHRIRALAKLDREAATHVETVICMRTDFTGDPPYVGWKGLGLALKEALDERDRLRNGAGKTRSRSVNPLTGTWTKRDDQSGKFMDVKADPKPFKGVRKEKKKQP